MKQSKRQKENLAKADRGVAKPLSEAAELVKETSNAKFDETIDLAVNLGVDPRHADQMIRASVSLPHGTGKTVRVLAFAQGDKATEAQEAGADFVGAADMVDKINGGWMDFDRVVACPDVMGLVGRLGRILGPRGLMPNPKLGSVTFDIGKAINEIKAGQVSFRVEKAGIIHAGIGKGSFSADQIADNARTVLEKLKKMRPSSSKGIYMQKVTLSGTMGPGIRVDLQSF